MNLKNMAIWFFSIITSIVIILSALVWGLNYHPDQIQSEPVIFSDTAPVLKSGQSLKVLSFNVQYMAGKNYTFFYDVLDGSGPDIRPSTEDISMTFKEVVRVIKSENPDVVLLQEVDEGAKRTDYENQTERLMKMLPREYSSYTSSFYWKSAFVPHPKIFGAVGMKLLTISKYKISKAVRHQLALIPADPISKHFNLKRAILEVRMPIEGGKNLVIMNTHFDAFSQGTDTMQRQVAYTFDLLKGLDKENLGWIIGGDFNLLPPGQYEKLPPSEQAYYIPKTELAMFYKEFAVIPSLEQTSSENRNKWFTHFPNDSPEKGPDRTIDYLVHSNMLLLKSSYIRQHDTLHISDHLPVIATFRIP